MGFWRFVASRKNEKKKIENGPENWTKLDKIAKMFRKNTNTKLVFSTDFTLYDNITMYY
jgi:hypothetical protein